MSDATIEIMAKQIAELEAALRAIIEAWEAGSGFHGDSMVSALDHARALLQKSTD